MLTDEQTRKKSNSNIKKRIFLLSSEKRDKWIKKKMNSKQKMNSKWDKMNSSWGIVWSVPWTAAAGAWRGNLKCLVSKTCSKVVYKNISYHKWFINTYVYVLLVESVHTNKKITIYFWK